MNWVFISSSAILGAGLAMDAFSVSIANGLAEHGMRARKQLSIAGCFAFFQFLMPLIGWICVHTVVNIFTDLQRFIPWVALGLLTYIGIKMLIEGVQTMRKGLEPPAVDFRGLILQGIATSIDALSVGFAIASYDALAALVCSLIIAAVTFVICMVGVRLGKTLGHLLAGRANILGGVILIAIGINIFLRG